MNEAFYPVEMIDAMIESLQKFIIDYLLKPRTFFSQSPNGFVKALKKILSRRFPGGANFNHLLASDRETPDYFPWEDIFDMSEVKECKEVIETKKLLKDTFLKLKDREITLKLLKTLLLNDEINPRIQDLVIKVHKPNLKSTIEVC